MAFQGYSVLLVEDDPSWQFNYRDMLEESGVEVEVAASLIDARQLYSQSSFNLAIVDLRLVDDDPTNMDGIEVVRMIRASDVGARIIVKSGYLTPEIRSELVELGVDGILNKDGSADLLRDLIDRVLSSG